MGETDVHRNAMVEIIESLKVYYAGQQVYASGNLLMFYRPGDKRRHLSPDVMVVKGVPPGERLNYLIWEEGQAPNVVMEITSPSTKREDLKTKFEIYRTEVKVSEYFLFDPKDEYLSPRLQGFRLTGEEYVSIEMVDGRLPSLELGLHLEAAGERLRLYNPATERWLPTFHEMHRQAEQGQRRAELEKRRAEQAKLKAEQAKLKAEQAKLKAELAQQQAEQDKQRADQHVARLQRELAELRQRLAGNQ